MDSVKRLFNSLLVALALICWLAVTTSVIINAISIRDNERRISEIERFRVQVDSLNKKLDGYVTTQTFELEALRLETKINELTLHQKPE